MKGHIGIHYYLLHLISYIITTQNYIYMKGKNYHSIEHGVCLNVSAIDSHQ